MCKVINCSAPFNLLSSDVTEYYLVYKSDSFRAFLFFFFLLTQAEKSFQPVESPYFCVDQQKKEPKEPLEKY